MVGLHTRDREGRLTDHKWDFSAIFDMPLQSKLTLEEIYRDERRGSTLFEDLASHIVKFEIQPGEALRLEGSFTVGDAIDYRNARLAEEQSCELTAEVKPGIHWNAKLVVTDFDLDAAGRTAGRHEAGRLPGDLQLQHPLAAAGDRAARRDRLRGSERPGRPAGFREPGQPAALLLQDQPADPAFPRLLRRLPRPRRGRGRGR